MLRAPAIDPQTAQAHLEASPRRQLLLPSLLAMTFATGLIDAVSYLAIGSVFTANMTGNVVLLGFGLGGVNEFPVDRALLALLAFAAGGVIAGRLARTWHHAPFVWFRRVTAIEIVLVAAAGALLIGLPVGIETPDEPRRYGAIAVLGLAMGLRNATVRRLGFKDVPTTVLTSTVTDLATDSRLGGGERRSQGIRVTAILAMLAGAIVGALLIGVSALAALGAAEVILLAVAAHQAYVARTVPGQTPPSAEGPATPRGPSVGQP